MKNWFYFQSLYYLHNFVISETGCNICSSDLFSDFRKSITSIYKLYNTPYISYNYVKLGRLIEKVLHKNVTTETLTLILDYFNFLFDIATNINNEFIISVMKKSSSSPISEFMNVATFISSSKLSLLSNLDWKLISNDIQI